VARSDIRAGPCFPIADSKAGEGVGQPGSHPLVGRPFDSGDHAQQIGRERGVGRRRCSHVSIISIENLCRPVRRPNDHGPAENLLGRNALAGPPLVAAVDAGGEDFEYASMDDRQKLGEVFHKLG
jgi:hypothetical protein